MNYLKVMFGAVMAMFALQTQAYNYAAAKADSYFEDFPEEYDNYAWQREESVDAAQLAAQEAVRAAEEQYNEEHPKVVAACMQKFKLSESHCEEIVPEMTVAECMRSLDLDAAVCRQRY